MYNLPCIFTTELKLLLNFIKEIIKIGILKKEVANYTNIITVFKKITIKKHRKDYIYSKNHITLRYISIINY
jgi:hypothetical protein